MEPRTKTVSPTNYLKDPALDPNNPMNKSMVEFANNNNFNPNDVAKPEPIPAATIGTKAPSVPSIQTPPNLSEQIAKLQTQALSLKETIDARAAQEATALATPPRPGTNMTNVGDQALQNYLNTVVGGFQMSQEAQGLQTQAAMAGKTAKDLANDITAYAKDTRDAVMQMRRNPEGKLADSLQAQITNFEYDRYNKKDGLADMAIAAQYAQNNAEFAYEIANNAVTAEREQYNSQLRAFKDIFDMSRNDMSESEKLEYQSELRLYENQIESLSASKEAAMQRAAQAGAPEDVVLAIKNATTPEEVWAAAGSYGEDPAMKLAWARFDWERNKYYNDLAIQQQLQAGQIQAEEALDRQTKSDALYNAGLYQTSIGGAKNNLKGLMESTGTTALGRFAPFSADRSRFLASAKYLLSNETFKKLADITANTSLGAISEGELALVQEAATELGAYAIEEDGELKGFKGSHEDVLAAIIKLEDAQTRYMDTIRRGTLTPEEYNAIGGSGETPLPEDALLRANTLLEKRKQRAIEQSGFGSKPLF